MENRTPYRPNDTENTRDSVGPNQASRHNLQPRAPIEIDLRDLATISISEMFRRCAAGCEALADRLEQDAAHAEALEMDRRMEARTRLERSQMIRAAEMIRWGPGIERMPNDGSAM